MDDDTLSSRSRQAVWHPCTQMKQLDRLPLIAIAKAAGAWLYDSQGKRYLDAISSWWVNLFGHANPRINAAITAQLQELEHVMLAGFTHAPVVQLSERLAQLAPGNLGHCFYASDGASAIEIALKMSFHFWRNQGHAGKNEFISVIGGYHGETLGALSVTDVALFRDSYAPLLRPSAHMPSPDARLAAAGESALEYALRCAEQVAAYLEQNHSRTAALIVEPLVQCAGGMAMHPPEYLARLREICRHYHVHLIADEIAVGFGRSGSFFAWEQVGKSAVAAPDFLCLSKGLTGGYLPLSVVMTHDEIFQAFYADDVARGFLHSHSYTGNALACRAALATLDIFEQDDVIRANQSKARQFSTAMLPLREHPQVKNFRQCGMIWAFDVETDLDDFSARFYSAALQRGVVLRPLGKTVYFMPPYIVTAEEMNYLIEQTTASLNAL